jgi:hypothetical protein
MLYRRLSTGHAGVFCEGCHGSTHAESPVTPASGPVVANDNQTALQLRGHTGKITECGTCHTGDLGATLNGPQGMHPVGNTSFSDGGHQGLARSKPGACRACHGASGQGTVLSRTAADRTLSGEDRSVSVVEGQAIGCNLCHGNPLSGGGGGAD